MYHVHARPAVTVIDRYVNVPGMPTEPRVVPIRFTPRERQFAGRECGGVQILVTDWDAFEPLTLGIALAVVLRDRDNDRDGTTVHRHDNGAMIGCLCIFG